MRPHLLLIDNYDSFTYNLVQAFLVLGAEVRVYRNDAIATTPRSRSRRRTCASRPDPARPTTPASPCDMIGAFAGRVPILGVCLGHQAIVEVFGGRVVRAERLMHGKTSLVAHDGEGLFAGLPQPFEVGRYHSLVADPGEPARGARGDRAHRGRGDHGRASPHARGRGRAVSSRERADAGRAAAARQLPRRGRRAARRAAPSAEPGMPPRGCSPSSLRSGTSPRRRPRSCSRT